MRWGGAFPISSLAPPIAHHKWVFRPFLTLTTGREGTLPMSVSHQPLLPALGGLHSAGLGRARLVHFSPSYLVRVASTPCLLYSHCFFHTVTHFLAIQQSPAHSQEAPVVPRTPTDLRRTAQAQHTRQP